MADLSKPRVGVLVFPGSNDDRDAAWALTALGAEPVMVWHAEPELPEVGAVVLPGGFSYGDYLAAAPSPGSRPRCARWPGSRQPGGPVLGICNGFQILCEAGLLPGALCANESLSFVCEDVEVQVERSDIPSLARCGGRPARDPGQAR